MTGTVGFDLPLRSSMRRTAARACVVVGLAAGAWLAGSTAAHATSDSQVIPLPVPSGTVATTVKSVADPVVEPATKIIHVAAPRSPAPVHHQAPVVAAVVKAIPVGVIRPVRTITDVVPPVAHEVRHTATEVEAPVTQPAKSVMSAVDSAAPSVRTAASEGVRTVATIADTAGRGVVTAAKPVVVKAAPVVRSVAEPIVAVTSPVVEVATKPLVAPVSRIATAVKPAIAAAQPVVHVATKTATRLTVVVKPVTRSVAPLVHPITPILHKVDQAVASVVGILDPVTGGLADVGIPVASLIPPLVSSGLSVMPVHSSGVAIVNVVVRQVNPVATITVTTVTVHAHAVTESGPTHPSVAMKTTAVGSPMHLSVTAWVSTSQRDTARAVPSDRSVHNHRNDVSRVGAGRAGSSPDGSSAARSIDSLGAIGGIASGVRRGPVEVTSTPKAGLASGKNRPDDQAPAPLGVSSGAGSAVGGSSAGSPHIVALAPTADFARLTLLAALSSSDDAHHATLADRPTFSPD